MRRDGGGIICRRAAERAFDQVVRIVGAGVIAPKPAHHFRQLRASLFLPVQPVTPGVIKVVSFFRQRLDQADILKMPISSRVVFVAVQRPVVVHSIDKENANGLALARQNFFRMRGEQLS